MVILDTCAIIELANQKPKISKKTIKKIEEGAYILSISFAEIACKIKSGKLIMDISASDLYEQYLQIPAIDFVSICVDDWLYSIKLDWDNNRDPADRLLVAFAQKKKISIVTSDKKIKSFYQNIIW